ncbi:MAG: hypothetical protein ACLGIK_16795, partial [Gemmatimonadota bacterium]
VPVARITAVLGDLLYGTMFTNFFARRAGSEAQADDIDGVTWVTTTAAPGTILDVRLDEVVDDYDFRATAMGVLDAPSPAPMTRTGRVLPVAPGSVGSFGR